MLSQRLCPQANQQSSCAVMHVCREALASLHIRHVSRPCMQVHRWILQPMQYVRTQLRVLPKSLVLCSVLVYMLHTYVELDRQRTGNRQLSEHACVDSSCASSHGNMSF